MRDGMHKRSYMRGMNRLPVAKRVQILSMLVEGSSLRSISRIAGVSIKTVTKLIISWWVGGRDAQTGYQFLTDLETRLTDRVQLTSDGLPAYLQAVPAAFSDDVDFAQLVKIYRASPASFKGRYSPAECIGAKKKVVSGNPDPNHISTSYVERQNLTMRMSMRRFTRLTNAFSKKFQNHCHSLALYFVWYNWMRKHKAIGTTPAIAAGLADKAMTMTDLVELMDAREFDALQDKRERILSLSN